MKKNIGLIDKTIRIILVAAVAILLFTHQLTGIAAILSGIAAAILLTTVFVGTCPIYLLLGISSKGKRKKQGTQSPEFRDKTRDKL